MEKAKKTIGRSETLAEITVLKPKYRVDEVITEIRECLEKWWTGAGYKTTQAETMWKAYSGLPNALFLNSCTSALHLGWEALKRKHKWEPHHQIITTPLTFCSTNHTILHAGLTPVFCDVDDSLNLDPEDFRKKITKDTVGVVFVGIGGNSANYQEILEIARANGLVFALDAAHMAGTKLNGNQIGVEADFSAFSFHSVKNLPTADSGMLCLKDAGLHETVKDLSWLGISKSTFDRSAGSYQWDYSINEPGFKYNGNSIMAAMFLVGLKYLDEDNKARNYLANIYDRCIPSRVKKVVHIPGTSRHLYQILVKNRDDLVEKLRKNGVSPGVHYKSNLLYPMYCGECPNAQKLSKEILTLPLHLNLTPSDIQRVSDLL